MRAIYIDGAIAGGGTFPTEFRYIDWILTVPLMLAQFPMHLGLGRRGYPFMVWLMGMSVGMLAFGYIGEVNPDHPELQVLMWVIGCLFGVAIFLPLDWAPRRLPPHVSGVSARTVRAMTLLTLVGWLVYPIGYLQPLIGFPADIRELVYNFADVINKVGLGAFIFWGGRAALRDLADRRPGRSTPAQPVAEPAARSATDSLLAGS